MRNVESYAEMRDRVASVATHEPDSQAKAWFIVGPNSKQLARAEVSLIEYHALKNGMLVTVIDDPESTRKAHIVYVAVNGTAAQMVAFTSAMTRV